MPLDDFLIFSSSNSGWLPVAVVQAGGAGPVRTNAMAQGPNMQGTRGTAAVLHIGIRGPMA